LRWAAEGIFDGGVLGQQFGRQVGIGDILVMGWESVPRQAEGAYPEFPPDIYLANLIFNKSSPSRINRTHTSRD